MRKAQPDHRRFFEETEEVEELARSLLPGDPPRGRLRAARALTELAADRGKLAELLRTLPGGALAALALAVEGRHPLPESVLVEMADAALGKGRGASAFRAALGSGFLAGLDEPRRERRFAVWPPFEEPLRALLAGVHLVERPEPEGPVPPDRGAFAFAVLLGQLAQRAPRMTADGPLFKRDEEELEALFAPALGAGNVATFVAAAEELGLAFVEEVGAQGRGSRRIRLDPEAAEAFLALPRGARVRRLATAFPIPRWLSAAFSAGGRFVPIGALTAARRLDVAWGPLQGEGESDWLAFLVAAGVLEERDGAYRAARELRADGEPRPCAGRWHVQPNLEVLVPPDVPLPDALRLSRVAELVSIDRAAVFRLTPASLSCAAAQGLSAAEVEAVLSARAAAPPGDVALRSVRDGVKAPPLARAFEGTFAVLPPAALSALRARPDFAALVRGEPAPGVVWVADGARAKLAKALDAQGVELRFPPRREPSERWRADEAERTLRRLLDAEEARPDAALAAAVDRARRGEAAELAPRTPLGLAAEPSTVRPGPPAREPKPEVQRERTAEVVALLVELERRAQSEEPPSFRGLPLRDVELAMREIERVTGGRLAAEDVSASTLDVLRHLVSRPGTARRGQTAPPTGVGLDGHSPPEMLPGDWKAEAERALLEECDLWIQLAQERRPRLVTPHRIAHRGGEAQLEALAHDSGDLRVYPAAAISGAALAGKSAGMNLPRAGAPAVALRAARNDRCPCGSNKKYKQCCLPGDLAGGAGSSITAGGEASTTVPCEMVASSASRSPSS